MSAMPMSLSHTRSIHGISADVFANLADVGPLRFEYIRYTT